MEFICGPGSEIGETTFMIPQSTPKDVFTQLMSTESMKKWAMGGGCSKAMDVSASPPNIPESKRCVIVEKETNLSGTVKGLWSLLDKKTDEFVRFEVRQVFYAGEITTKEALAETPTLTYKCDFNLFVDDNGSGVEVIRNTFDFEQSSALPIFIGLEVADENAAMIEEWGK
mmetsp:Transcript_86972/g.168450  ORF Transcript_86972/g.168450 Transcript_86972/m.168450 type:complete len:171 (+) Transcript_86972:141-653(+)|eukprot:CAMPEP_0171686364 /NCGR_PEP_ID=MMETSP0991-20121206/2757_1 /TAXON_ID=483369 /ORGANISM="non described non described, Strain CCMP2098" /LENGTH=170 /DNA_ID=CAMNT_0012274103 /DNA_START=84 /DNA_END=596 /DNA_ORIENTATION=+